jgi:thiopurine S-methyltransferase
MEKDFWQSKWESGDISFNRSEPNAFLEKYLSKLAPYPRIYLPLCGKSIDLVRLRTAQHTVFGTEIVPLAVTQFFAERGTPASLRTTEHFRVHSSADYTILEGNAFSLKPADLGGQVDAIYDRASLVALDPSTRQTFVESLMRVLRKEGVMLLVVFDYDQKKLSGPPWAVSDETVRALFAPHAEVTLLETREEPVASRFQEAGVTSVFERAYWIQKLPAAG